MIASVPGPSTRTGTSQSRSISSNRSWTASRKSTKLRLRVAITSSVRSWDEIAITPSPRSPSRKPSPRKIIGNESGARSTSGEASAEISRTAAIRANPVSRSGIGQADSRKTSSA
jgi:hypothetical protein